MRRKEIVWRVAIGVVVILVYRPVFIWLAGIWLDDPYFGHGFLLIPVAAALVWWRRKELAWGDGLKQGAIVLAAGLALYAWSFLNNIRFAAALSLIPVLLGLALYLGGRRSTCTLAFPVCFLIFMVPLPFLDELTVFLQSLTTRWSAVAVGAMGIPVTTVGSQVHLPYSTFVIGLACSGMSTLISLLALAALGAYILQGRIGRRVLLFVLAFPIAILANTLRIISLLLIGHRWGVEVAMAYFHHYSSLVFYLTALFLLGFIAWALGCRSLTLSRRM